MGFREEADKSDCEYKYNSSASLVKLITFLLNFICRANRLSIVQGIKSSLAHVLSVTVRLGYSVLFLLLLSAQRISTSFSNGIGHLSALPR
jgi:hypothetical protein